MRVVRVRSLFRQPDLEVEPIPPESGNVSPSTRRSFERRAVRGAQASSPVDGHEDVHSSDLILEKEDGRGEDTPVTIHTPWMRQIPPPLPRS